MGRFVWAGLLSKEISSKISGTIFITIKSKMIKAIRLNPFPIMLCEMEKKLNPILPVGQAK